MSKVSSDDGVIDLKGDNDLEFDNSFSISHIDDENLLSQQEPINPPSNKSVSSEVSSKVVISFERFVNLIASHDYETVFKKDVEKDVIISADLLAELANAHTEDEVKDEKKVPYLFIAGLVFGALIMWFILK